MLVLPNMLISICIDSDVSFRIIFFLSFGFQSILAGPSESDSPWYLVIPFNQMYTWTLESPSSADKYEQLHSETSRCWNGKDKNFLFKKQTR